MTSLLDIGELTEEVEVHGVKLTVQGLTAGHLFQLFSEFPEMRKMIAQKAGSPQEMMLALAPDLIAKIIALTTEKDPVQRKLVETKAKTLGASDQLIVLEAVQRLSFPDGIGPFVERVTAISKKASAGLPEAGSTISSNSTTASPAPFNALLQTDGPPNLRGHARRAN